MSRRKLTAPTNLRAIINTNTAAESVLAEDDIEDIRFLLKARLASNAVCSIDNVAGSKGTGFLISPNLVMTNNHVIPDKQTKSSCVFQNGFKIDNGNLLLPPLISRKTEPEKLFITDKRLDFTIVAIHTPIENEFIVLRKNNEVNVCNIIHYPNNGGFKSISLKNNNQNTDIPQDLVPDFNDKIWYSSDTSGGSSGAPVFNNNWQIVALHHAFLPAFEKNSAGKYFFKKATGKVSKEAYDQLSESAKQSFIPLANEGIKIAAIIDFINQVNDPLLLNNPLFKELLGIINQNKLPPNFTLLGNSLNETSVAYHNSKQGLIV